MENLNVTHQLTNLFTHWRVYTEYSSHLLLNDVNKTNETLGGLVLNKLKGWNLEDLNAKKPNFPAIDLGDESKGIGVSVTATNDSTYIHDKIKTNIDHKVYEKFPNHYFLITTQKKGYTTTFDTKGLYSFNVKDHVFDIQDLLTLAVGRPVEEQKELLKILQDNVGSFKSHFIEEITPQDIAKILAEFSSQNQVLINQISPNIQAIQRTDFFNKNIINGLSEGYIKLIQQQSLPFFDQFSTFLESFENRELKKAYLNVAGDLQKVILLKRNQFAQFDELFHHIEEQCRSLLPSLNLDRRTLQILLHFMYFQCDIGENQK